MATAKAVFLGKQNSGKTKLIEKIIFPKINFVKEYQPSMSADFLVRETEQNNTVQLWDLPGNEKHESVGEVFIRYAKVCIFCVDLTEEVDEAYISRKVDAFRNANPDSPIILVGTKSDSPNIKTENFEKIKLLGLFSDSIITSAKDGTGVEELFSCMSQVYIREIKHLF